MISKEEVLHIAKLARLELTEQEIPKMQKDLSAILDYFTVLEKAVKVTKAPKAAKAENITRIDKAEQKPASLANQLVAAAPDKKDDFVKVKQVL